MIDSLSSEDSNVSYFYCLANNMSGSCYYVSKKISIFYLVHNLAQTTPGELFQYTMSDNYSFIY